MKKILKSLMLVILFFSCDSDKIRKNITTENDIPLLNKNSYIVIYNFYGKHRCPSCIAIEENTIKLLNSLYSNYLKDSIIIQKSINIELPQNASIAEKYQVYGSGLYICNFNKGKESVINLTAEGFKFALRKPEMFAKVFTSKIDSLLKKLNYE
ncbi:MAG: nitrophenyl compound nitroreductase subunit ArsF family protein [Bacteroidales bacterium]|nr:nitrophenyl compound nitroreductase subunit ArsF family protein [Bacteroidales bacterium]